MFRRRTISMYYVHSLYARIGSTIPLCRILIPVNTVVALVEASRHTHTHTYEILHYFSLRLFFRKVWLKRSFPRNGREPRILRRCLWLWLHAVLQNMRTPKRYCLFNLWWTARPLFVLNCSKILLGLVIRFYALNLSCKVVHAFSYVNTLLCT